MGVRRVNAYGLEIEVYSVSQITDRVARLLQADAVLADVWVSGEISNFTHHSSGHMYMTLKDDASRLRAVMFQGPTEGFAFVRRAACGCSLTGTWACTGAAASTSST